MVDLHALQADTAAWRDKNFPEYTSEDQLMGVVEEVGELTHHVLKRKQGIRGTLEEHNEGIADSVGDIVIYLAGFCSASRISLDSCVEHAWRQVQQRDWVNNPTTGQKEG